MDAAYNTLTYLKQYLFCRRTISYVDLASKMYVNNNERYLQVSPDGRWLGVCYYWGLLYLHVCPLYVAIEFFLYWIHWEDI